MADQRPIEQSDWITVAEAADLTGDSEKRILQLIQSGKIQTKSNARSVLVKRTTLLAAHRDQAESAQGLYPSQVALAVIEGRSAFEKQQRNAEAIGLLTEWMNATGEEAEDQYDTLAYLIAHLDEHRASNRVIFPAELKEQLRHALKQDE
jgi:hypothetical protein